MAETSFSVTVTRSGTRLSIPVGVPAYDKQVLDLSARVFSHVIPVGKLLDAQAFANTIRSHYDDKNPCTAETLRVLSRY